MGRQHLTVKRSARLPRDGLPKLMQCLGLTFVDRLFGTGVRSAGVFASVWATRPDRTVAHLLKEQHS